MRMSKKTLGNVWEQTEFQVYLEEKQFPQISANPFPITKESLCACTEKDTPYHFQVNVVHWNADLTVFGGTEVKSLNINTSYNNTGLKNSTGWSFFLQLCPKIKHHQALYYSPTTSM